jgi:hypothetical protein
MIGVGETVASHPQAATAQSTTNAAQDLAETMVAPGAEDIVLRLSDPGQGSRV